MTDTKAIDDALKTIAAAPVPVMAFPSWDEVRNELLLAKYGIANWIAPEEPGDE